MSYVLSEFEAIKHKIIATFFLYFPICSPSTLYVDSMLKIRKCALVELLFPGATLTCAGKILCNVYIHSIFMSFLLRKIFSNMTFPCHYQKQELVLLYLFFDKYQYPSPEIQFTVLFVDKKQRWNDFSYVLEKLLQWDSSSI